MKVSTFDCSVFGELVDINVAFVIVTTLITLLRDELARFVGMLSINKGQYANVDFVCGVVGGVLKVGR